MTAKVVAEAYHPLPCYAESQGSIQLLDNGNLLIGWGLAAAFTEFSPDGKRSSVTCNSLHCIAMLSATNLHRVSRAELSRVPGKLERVPA